jgi:hypothetical protein
MLRRCATSVVLLGLACSAGCSSRAAEESADALDSALSTQDFDATVRALTALPYLPWGYTPDGCYARALYYSMLLATKGVPTNHLYVVARPGTTLGGQWIWHVAPLVTKDDDQAHLFVLDPVYDKTKALTNLEWVAKQNYTDTTLTSYPSLHVRPGNDYEQPYSVDHALVSPAAPNVAEYKEPTFDAMPSFSITNASLACQVMHSYIDLEPGTDATQRAEKHTNLARETQKIVRALAAKGKLDGAPTGLSASCTQNEVVDAGKPIEPEPFVEPTRAAAR